MYKHIETQIIVSGISKRELAERLGISYNTLNQKLNGKSSFTLNEATELRRLLNTDVPIETLFDSF